MQALKNIHKTASSFGQHSFTKNFQKFISERKLSFAHSINERKSYQSTYAPLESTYNEKLYESHVRINRFQRSVLSIGAAVTSILNPRRHDMIAVFGETTGHSALHHIHKNMKCDAEGSRILQDRPEINTSTVDVESLAALPTHTLGFAYSRFLLDNGVTPDSRMPVQFVEDYEFAYVMRRYREVHDLVHTTLGMRTDMLGEVAVKWVEALQTGLPMCIAGAVFGPIRLRPKQRQRYITQILPWALRVGKQAKPLMNIYYEQRWEQDLDDFRREFNIEPPPKR